jgi:hypothetical protein
LSAAVQLLLHQQYTEHASWSVQLHYLNVKALAEMRPELSPVPCYATVRRFFKAQGLRKVRRVSRRRTEGTERAEQHRLKFEVRSYEVEYVNQLWHWDGHKASLSRDPGRPPPHPRLHRQPRPRHPRPVPRQLLPQCREQRVLRLQLQRLQSISKRS